MWTSTFQADLSSSFTETIYTVASAFLHHYVCGLTSGTRSIARSNSSGNITTTVSTGGSLLTCTVVVIAFDSVALTPMKTLRLAKLGNSSNSGVRADKSTGYLRLNVAKNPAATDLVYTAEVSSDLATCTSAGTTI